MGDEAIILAGGLGTRLRPVVSDVPKPLAPVAGRPFIAWLLDNLEAAGIRRVILAAGYGAQVLQRAIGHGWGRMSVDYSVEDRPLGTGGALKLAAARVQGNGVHVLNGDTFLALDRKAFARETLASGCIAGVALADVADAWRYGAVELVDGRVIGFSEKGRSGPARINAGAYFLTPAAIARLPVADAFSFESAVLEQLVTERQLAGFTATERFIDIGVPEDYALAQLLFDS